MALLVAALAVGQASAQATTGKHAVGEGTGASAELAGQKAMMLKGFFASSRLERAHAANPDAVAPLVAEARSHLDAGEEALRTGKVAEATEYFDAGMRSISRAVALGEVNGRSGAKGDFIQRRRHAAAYLSVIEQSADISAEERADAAALRKLLEKADRSFAAGELATAHEILDLTYRDIVTLVSDIQRGRTLVVSRVFQSPRDEFEYEQRRHESYLLLVQLALAERAEVQPGLAELADRLSTESGQLRDQAARESSGGDFVTAIDTMEQATERLLVILRATGLIVME